MKTFALVLLSIVIIALLVFAVLFVIEKNPLGAVEAGEGNDPSSTEEPVKGADTVMASCQLLPNRSVRLSFNAGGLLETLAVADGQEVQAGQVLALLDGQEQAESSLVSAQRELAEAEQALQKLKDEVYLTVARLQKQLQDARLAEKNASNQLNRLKDANKNADDIAQAEAVLGLARAELQQFQEAYENNKYGPDPQVLAAAELRLKEAKAHLAAAQEVIAERQLLAPFAGQVIQVYLAPGEFAGPGVPILLLADTSSFHVVTTDLNELNILKVQPGESVVVNFDAQPQTSFEGVVRSILAYGQNKLGEVMFTVTIDGDFNQPWLMWGMTCSALIGEQP